MTQHDFKWAGRPGLEMDLVAVAAGFFFAPTSAPSVSPRGDYRTAGSSKAFATPARLA